MITRERVVIRDEKKIIPPGMEMQLINESSINAISTKIDDEYCIFIYKGILEEQKEYLRHYDWNFFSSEEQKERYLDDIIEYGFYFIEAHEYAHVFCRHLDVRLTEPNELITEECEADMFSIDYLMKYIQFKKNIIEKLQHIKRIGNAGHSIDDIKYAIVEDSINKIRKSIKDIQKKIPRFNA